MSEITLTVVAEDRSIHGHVPGSDGDRIVAALAADPRTIAELDQALGRYQHRYGDNGYFEGWASGVSHQPWDAGIVLVDLVARLVVSRSTYSSFCHRGEVRWHDGEAASNRTLPFCLADDWMFSDDVEGFQPLSAKRRAKYDSANPFDARAVIYERLAEFIVREVHAHQGELREMDGDARDELARDIHVRWMLSPRDDLGARCPRELMIDSRHDHIMWDVQNQQHRWSLVGDPPPGIPRESAAYRLGGFGTHEIVLYYDLVRELLHECISRMAVRPVTEDELSGEADHLRQVLQEWMHGANHEELHGRSPASVIDRERRRLPESMSGEEAVIDHDCPLCQMMADEQFGPMFWHLDGCNMDPDFAFSFHPTREEWENEQREFEEWSRKFDEQRRRDKDFIEGQTAAKDYLEADDAESSVWRTSFSNQDVIDDMPAAQAMPLMLFSIGAHLGELGEKLKTHDDGEERARSLRAQFTELRHAISDRNPWMAESAVAHFSEQLRGLGVARPEFVPQCTDLDQQLDRLLERCRDVPDFDDSIPF